jgi:creatinine amidohydrolase
MTALLENVCEEIARNGMKKIILLNGHGGNEGFLSLFAFRMLERPRDFTLYVIRLSEYLRPMQQDPRWKAMMVSEFDEHGGEGETSLMMALHPQLVKLEQLAHNGQPRKRLSHLAASTPVWWYADYPDHYAGDATHATPEKGAFLLDEYVARIATIIKAVKEDTVAPALQREFDSRVEHGT